MKKICFLLSFVCISLLWMCVFSSCVEVPAPANIFEEIYRDNAYGRNMVDRVPQLNYDKSWTTFGIPWHDNLSSLGYKNLPITIYCTRPEKNIIFVHRQPTENAQEDGEHIYSSYRYSFETKELTYATNSFEQTDPHPFLFDVVISDWLTYNAEQTDKANKSAFSMDDLGEYTWVSPWDA